MSLSTAIAELIADRGEAATSEEFFRSRPFLDAEGVTHTLRIETEDAELLAPLIVRPIGEGPEIDAISPYGYPGLAPPPDSSIDPASIDFAPTGLVSLFIRHIVGDPPLAGSSQRNVVQIADQTSPPKSRMSDRQQIRKNLRRGYELRIVPGPETSPAERAGFLAAYEQTMRRTNAAERYFFGAAYFDRILTSNQTWLALAVAPSGEIAAASIAARSDGTLHYYLSGSADAHLSDSPMKNVVATLVEHASKLGLPLNLGGGIQPGDPLEEFKRGFANREQPWHTSEIVCDSATYEQLARVHESSGDFFPAYRA
ncbi:MAG TPA: GNAT family N-acetyltransferase [Solirubrobacterales bacterium]|nr:GNAT family N-acetyltransferase [Solirubrobacterales bacterium]